MRMGVGLHRFDDSRAIEAKWESILDQAVRESHPLATLARVSSRRNGGAWTAP
jgi:hypothetical protein